MISLKSIKSSVDKKRRSKDTEYLYATAYLRSIEEKGLGRELLLRMLDAATAEEAFSQLTDVYGDGDDELICDKIVNEAYRTVDDVVGVPDMFTFMRYPYDANNIKTAIKCAAVGMKTDGLMFGCGTLPTDEYAAIVESKEYGKLPEALAEAAKNAADAYAKTGDPQSIDLPIDRACLSAMAEKADATGSAFIKNAISLRVDIANIMSAIRVCRMGDKTIGGVLETALADGGAVPKKLLIDASAKDDATEAICAVVAEYRPELSESITPEQKLGELERALENCYLDTVYAARKLSFGCEVPFAYLVASEYNSKNARIILAGKRAGLSPDAIRERMRMFYV